MLLGMVGIFAVFNPQLVQRAWAQAAATLGFGLSPAVQVPTISTSTFTPDLNAANVFSINLVHASCPCTIANPSNIGSRRASEGIIEIKQSSTGSDAVTWGSDYVTAGGVSGITLSTAANAVDYIGYHVGQGSTVVLFAPNLNPTH
jgi:hypothetical protein